MLIIDSGDSYSRINFKPDGEQPSASNPFGNHGKTSSNGKNWVDFLTTTYNQSLFLTYDLAQSGATIDQDVLSSSSGTDVASQLNDTFLQKYAAPNFFEGSTSLVPIWIGINDLVNSYLNQNLSAYTAAINRLYELVEQMHDAGLRNFLFINIPPLERSPRVTGSSASATRIPVMKAAVADYNSKLYKLARKVNHDLAHTTVFFFDAYKLFNQVMDDPTQFEETSVYKNTLGYCSAYQNGTPEWDDKYDECEYAANEYFWINNLHPSQSLHHILAKEIVQELEKGLSL